MKPFLMGSETEFAVSGRRKGQPLSPDAVFVLLFHHLRQSQRWFRDASARCAAFLGTGGRLYMDWHSHPEYATPECHTPREVACHDKAAEHLLLAARARAQKLEPDVELTVLKTNLDPVCPDAITWGCHESYTCWAPVEQAAKALLPHLVTRILYAGAGCLSSHPASDGFELSQRARHLVRPVGTETTVNRAIFCHRLRKAVDSGEGWTRLHLISKDSQRSPFGVYLTFGTTGLLLFLLNAGRQVGAGLELQDPVRALRTISCDPWLKGVRVPLADGRRLTALEIQSCYLEECEREVQKGGLPPWAPEVLHHWRQTLEALAVDPLRLADRLDSYGKLRLYERALGRAGFGWNDLHAALVDLFSLRQHYPEAVVRALLQDESETTDREQSAQEVEAAILVGADTLRGRERLRLAARMLALDVHYHELGGLYDQLEVSGQIDPVVVTAEDVCKAKREAPPGGRAAVRASWIQTHHRHGWLCDWHYLFHVVTGELLDLRNPFSDEVKTIWPCKEDSPYDAEMAEILEVCNRAAEEPWLD